MVEGYWQTYWASNRVKILEKRAARYQDDKVYRDRTICAAKERYQKIRSAKPIVQKTVPKRVAAATRTLRPKPFLLPDGQLVMVQHMAELSRRCKVSPETIKTWEERGIVPGPTMLDEHGRRWYSPAYIEIMVVLVELHWNSVKGLEDFKQMVMAEFAKTGAK